MLPATRSQNHYYYPVAFLTWSKNPGKKMTPWQAITQSTDATPKLAKSGYLLAERTVAAYSEGVTVDWVFRIPAGQTPRSLTFRKTSTVTLPALDADPAKRPVFPEANTAWCTAALQCGLR